MGSARTLAGARTWLCADAIGPLLHERAWSQGGLAADIGIHRVTLSRYLRRRRAIGDAGLQLLARWAQRNGVAIDALVERAGADEA